MATFTAETGVAADMLTSAWGQNAGMYAGTPAAAVAEKVAGEWLVDILRLPRQSSVGFVTGATIVTVNQASKAQIDAAVAAAAGAFPAWSRTTPGARSAMLAKLADQLEAEAEAFAKLESQNCGKPPARALADELPPIIDCFRFFAGAARCLPGSAAGEYMTGFTSMVRRDPVGVVASIAKTA